jgi:hypothetical protein
MKLDSRQRGSRVVREVSSAALTASLSPLGRPHRVDLLGVAGKVHGFLALSPAYISIKLSLSVTEIISWRALMRK